MAADPRFYVSYPPHIVVERSIPSYMYNYLLALSPAAAAAIYYFRLEALEVMLLAVATAVICEAGMQRFLKRDPTISDGSAVLTALLLAFLLPAPTPWWIVIVGSVVAVVLGKQLFGGLGNHPFHSALVGWMVLRISWPERIAYWVEPFGGDLPFPPLEVYKFEGIEAFHDYFFQISDLAVGRQAGGIGTVFALGLLAGGIYLLCRRYITWHIPVGFLGVVSLFSGTMWIAAPGLYLNPLFHLFGGATLLGAFFIATDPVTSPLRGWPKLVYGVLCGGLVMSIRIWGRYPDGVVFAVLLANACTPLLNKFKPRPYGRE